MQRLGEVQTQLEGLKAANRAADDNLGRAVDAVGGAVSRSNGQAWGLTTAVRWRLRLPRWVAAQFAVMRYIQVENWASPRKRLRPRKARK